MKKKYGNYYDINDIYIEYENIDIINDIYIEYENIAINDYNNIWTETKPSETKEERLARERAIERNNKLEKLGI